MDPADAPLLLSRGEYELTTDRAKVDVDLVHRFLTTDSYWARGISRRRVETAIEESLVLVIRHRDEQVAFARVVTDYATFAYLADVFVVPSHRGKGLGHWLVETALDHPLLRGLRRWCLATADAHGLYASHGFAPLSAPEEFMEITRPYNPTRGESP